MKKEKKVPYWVVFVVGALFSFLLTTGVMGLFLERNVNVAFLDGKMSMWDAEDMCVEIHDRVLDSEGYCDVTSLDVYLIIAEEEEDSIYSHFFDCSWGKLKVRSLNEGFSLGDRWDFWITNCEIVKTVEEVR